MGIQGTPIQRMFLKLDNQELGAITSVSLPQETEPINLVGSVPSKLIQTVRHVISFEADQSIGKELFAWIEDFVGRKVSTKALAISLTDASGSVKSRITLHEAVLTEVLFPAVEASNKIWKIKVRVQGEKLTQEKSTEINLGTIATSGKRTAFSGNFRFRIGGLERDSEYVRSIGELGIEAKFAEGRTTFFRDTDLVVSFSSGRAEGVVQWFADALSKGVFPDRDAVLELGYPSPFLTLKFKGMGPLSISLSSDVVCRFNFDELDLKA